MIKTMFVAALLTFAACGGGKKSATTPGESPAIETPASATGGAAYGGGSSAPAPASKDTANPCASK